MNFRYFFQAALLATFIIFSYSLVYAQEQGQQEQTETQQASGSDEPEPPTGELKNIFLNLGYGNVGFSSGLGFRYSYFGACISAGAFANSRPNYARYDGFVGKDTTSERFTAIMVNFDIIGYFDLAKLSLFDYPLDDFSLFFSVGYYSQTDTMLVKGNDPAKKQSYNLYFFNNKTETVSGISLGGGIQWRITNSINVALGYHEKNGFNAQVGYYWR